MSEQIDGGKPLVIPVAAQMAVVNNMVLPLLKRTGIDVTVTTTKEGLTLSLVFKEPPELDRDNLGTDDPENARLLWALRDRVEQYRAEQSPPAL